MSNSPKDEFSHFMNELHPVNEVGVSKSFGPHIGGEGNPDEPDTYAEVDACDATECIYNADHNCKAGKIELRVSPKGIIPQCVTYKQEGE